MTNRPIAARIVADPEAMRPYIEKAREVIAFHRANFGGFRMEDDGGDGGGGDDGKGGNDFQPITSQADLDRILGARLAREREKTAEKLAEVESLREKASKYDEALEAAKSEQERAVDAARKEGETVALERANSRLVSAEARALAAHAKFRDPADAVAFLDLKDVKVGEDGSVDAEVLKGKLKALAESKPYLVDDGKGTRPKPDKDQGKPGGTPTPSVARGRELYEQRHPKKTA